MKSSSTKLTVKGQITLKKEYRDLLGLKPNDVVVQKYENGRIILEKLPNLLEVAGQLRKYTKNKTFLEDPRKYMEGNYKGRF